MEATAPGDVTVKIPANVVTENNFASATFKVHYKNTTGVAKLNSETEILIYPQSGQSLSVC
ncbi:MAG: hypothetical protein HC830_12920 [Bacteroidetes bacterium]|nr:hypothetical protein [Bacteroidota bacterium]